MSETKSRCKYCVRVEAFVEGNFLTWACAAFHDIYNNNAIYKLRNRSGRMSEELARTLKAMAREIARLYESELLLPKSPENQAIFEDALCEDWYTLESRAEKAEAMVEKLIEAGNRVSDNLDFVDGTTCRESLDEWDALVTEWRKGEQA